MDIKGLRLDNIHSETPIHTWAYAKNILLSKGFRSVENEKGTVIHYTLAANEILIKGFSTSVDHLLFIYDTVLTKGYIRKISIVNQVVTATNLFSSISFNIDNRTVPQAIDLVYLYNNLGKLIIAWTNNILPPMYLDTTDETGTNLNVSSTNFEIYYLFPHFKHPNYYLSKIINNGDLLTGCYFVSACYEIEDGINSNFGIISNPIYIVKNSTQDQYTTSIGCDVRQPANKSFEIELTNIDTRYKYIKLGVIYQTDTSLEAGITKKYPIASSKMSFIIDDFNRLDFLSINDITVSNPSFEKIKTLSISNNRLRFANVTKFNKLTTSYIYDNFINQISLDWLCAESADLITIKDSYKDSCFIFNSKGFKYDEVKAFYIGLKLKTGGYYGIYHLPGRVAIGTEATDLVTIDANTVDAKDVLKHKIDSTAISDFELTVASTVISYVTGLNYKTTITTTGNHNLIKNDYINIYGISGSNYDYTLANGKFQITKIDDTSFYYTFTVLAVIATGSFPNARVSIDRSVIYGKMGYWQNENETYNDQYGTILGSYKVRHHRFPSLLQISRWKNNLIESEITTTPTTYSQTGDSIYYVESSLGYVHLTFPTLFDGITFTPGSTVLRDKFTIPVGKTFELNGTYFIRSQGSLPSFTVKFDLTKDGASIIGGEKILTSKRVNIGYTTENQLSLPINGYLIPQGVQYDIDIKFTITSASGPFYTNGATKPLSLIDVSPTSITSLKQYILGVKLNIEYANIPQSILDLCDGIELFYAKPPINDSIILDQSITLSDGVYTRFYGFDSMSNKLNLNANILRSQLQYENTNLIEEDKTIIISALRTTKYSAIDSIKYTPQYNKATEPSNEGRENCYIIKTKHGNFNNCLSELISLKDDVYLDFTKQDLVSTGKIHKIIDIGNTFNKPGIGVIIWKKTGEKGLRIVRGYYDNTVLFEPNDIIWFSGVSILVAGYYRILEVIPDDCVIIDTDIVYNTPYTPNSLKVLHIPSFYGGDCYVSCNSLITYGSPSKVLNATDHIVSLTGSEGLATLTLKTSSLVTFDMFTIGDVLVISGITSDDSFNGTFTIASIDSNIKLTFKCVAKTTAVISSIAIIYYPVNVLYTPIHSISNIGFREEGTNQHEKFYPKTNILEIETIDTINRLKYISAMKEADTANLFIYNKTWHLLNTFRQDVIDGQISLFVTNYYSRIYSGLDRPENAVSSFWRKVKPLDYVDVSNDGDEIVKLFGHDKILYIKTKYGLKRGVTNDTLRTGDNVDISLKSTDIFDTPIQNVFDSPNRYIQSLNSLDTLFTPYGLISVDANSGDIYLITNETTELNKLGIEDWFRRRVKHTIFNITPDFKGEGVILGYDDINKRIFLTIKSSLITVTSVIRSGVGGILVTVTTTYNHNLESGDTVTMTGWDVPACNGNFVITILTNTTFTYETTVTTTGAVTNGTLKAVNDFTLTYNTEKNCWVAFHDYQPDQFIPNNNGFFYIKGNTIYQLGIGNYGQYEGTYYSSVIDFIFNDLNVESFLLNSVSWVNTVEDITTKYWNDTISKILIYSKNQCGNLITIAKKFINTTGGVITKTGNTQYSKGEWIFNDITDILVDPNTKFIKNDFTLDVTKLNNNKAWYTKSKFIGKSVIIRMQYDNTSANKKITIDNIKIDVKTSI